MNPALARPNVADQAAEEKTSISAHIARLRTALSAEPFSGLQFGDLFKEPYRSWCCLGSVEFEGTSVPIEVRQYSVTIAEENVTSLIEPDRLANSLRYRAKVCRADRLHQVFKESLSLAPTNLNAIKSRIDIGDYEVVKADGTRMTLQGESQPLGCVDCGTLGTVEFVQVTSPAAWFGGATVRVHSPESRVFWGELSPENYGYGKGGVSTCRVFPHGAIVAILSASISTPYDPATGKILVLGKYSEAQARLDILMREASELWEANTASVLEPVA
jgi:hypothetical protein